MKREFNVECTTGKPQVAYRETILSEADAEGKYVKQSEDVVNTGHVRVKFALLIIQLRQKTCLRILRDTTISSSSTQSKVEPYRRIIPAVEKV